MVQSPVFWLTLCVAILVSRVAPTRWRLWLLCAISLGYWSVESVARSLVPAYVHAAILLGMTVLIYALAPRTFVPPPTSKTEPRRRATIGQRLLFWTLVLLPLAYLVLAKFVMPARLASNIASAATEADVRQLFRGVHSVPNYALPLGISYITFKLIHAVIEMARGNLRNRRFDSFLAYVFLFPSASAGPIERYDHFLVNHSLPLGRQDIAEAGTRIIVGLIKRFVIAGMLLGSDWHFIVGGQLMANIDKLHSETLWRYAGESVLYIYLDFSAYSDIAIGASRLLGIRLMDNFDWPILASNLPAFWKRWHMTLTGWCQSYVYFPVLGLSRMPNLAIFITFVVIGLWHCNAFAILPWTLWGVYHGLGMVGYQGWSRLKRKRRSTWTDSKLWLVVAVVLTQAFVCAGELVALSEPTNLHDAWMLIGKLIFIHHP